MKTKPSVEKVKENAEWKGELRELRMKDFDLKLLTQLLVERFEEILPVSLSVHLPDHPPLLRISVRQYRYDLTFVRSPSCKWNISDSCFRPY